MDITTNERLIKRNARIGQITSIVGLVVLAGGMFISFTKPELFTFSLIALLVGFGLSQIGIYFGNRWGAVHGQMKYSTRRLKVWMGAIASIITQPQPHTS
jgi:O-antigen ligase